MTLTPDQAQLLRIAWTVVWGLFALLAGWNAADSLVEYYGTLSVRTATVREKIALRADTKGSVWVHVCIFLGLFCGCAAGIFSLTATPLPVLLSLIAVGPLLGAGSISERIRRIKIHNALDKDRRSK
jgi:hypothetical protein